MKEKNTTLELHRIKLFYKRNLWRITLLSRSHSPTPGCFCLKLLNKLMLPSTHQHRHLHAVFWLGRLRGWYSSKKRLLDVLKLHFSPASSFTLFRHPILLLWSSPLTVRQLCPSLQAVGLLMDTSITQDVSKFKYYIDGCELRVNCWT